MQLPSWAGTQLLQGEVELFSQSYPHPSFLEGPPVPMAMRMAPQPPMGSRSPRGFAAMVRYHILSRGNSMEHVYYMNM